MIFDLEKMATTADIQYYQRNRDGIVEYYIKIVHNGREWIVKKRYSEFAKLHEHLMKDGFDIKAKFPQKVMWKKNDKKILNKRFDELRLYFRELIKKYSVNGSLLKEFLEVETVFLRLAKKQSVAEAIRLDKIPSLLVRAMIPVHLLPRKSSLGSFQYHLPLKKAVSFSLSVRTPIRKDSITGHEIASTPGRGSAGGGGTDPYSARDRKFSVDMFNLTSGSLYSSDAISLHIAAKKGAFYKAIEALWEHYSKDIYDLDDREFQSELTLLERNQQHISRLKSTSSASEKERVLASRSSAASSSSRSSLSPSSHLTSSFQVILRELQSDSSFQSLNPRHRQHLSALEQIEEQFPSIDTPDSTTKQSVAEAEERQPLPALENLTISSGFAIAEIVVKDFQQVRRGSEEICRATDNTTSSSQSIPASPSSSGESLSQQNV